MTADLDTKILHMLDQLDRATPPPPAFNTLQPQRATSRSRFIGVAAAAAIGVAGLGGVVAVDSRDTAPTPPAEQPPAEPAALGTAATPSTDEPATDDDTEQPDPETECRAWSEILNTELTGDQLRRIYDYLAVLDSSPVDPNPTSDSVQSTDDATCSSTELTDEQVHAIFEYLQDL